MEKAGHIVKIIAFLLIIMILIIKIGEIFEPKWYGEWNNTDNIDNFYTLPKNSIDILVVGSSQVIKGFSSLELYNNYGFSAYGLGTEQQSYSVSYSWIKESLKTQKEKIICFEVKMLFEETPEGQNRKGIDNMKLSKNKLECIINDSIEKKSYTNFISYLFPLTRFHSRWKDLNDIDFTKKHTSKSYRGYSIDNRISGNNDYKTINEEIKNEREIKNKSSLKYFQKIVDLCKRKDIELILIKNPDKDWDEERYNTISKLAKENNLEYLDFNTEELSKQISFDYSKDSGSRNHLNIYGAEKVTNYIGKYISENYNIEDKRNNLNYSYLRDEADSYNYEIENKKLTNIFDVSDYLKTLKKGDFTLVISKNTNFNEEISDEFKELLSQLGFDIEKVKYKNYCAIISNDNTIQESSYEEIEIEKNIKNNLNIKIKADTKASIILNGVELSNNHSGFNILIYNNRNSKTVESMYIDYVEGNAVMGR